MLMHASVNVNARCMNEVGPPNVPISSDTAWTPPPPPHLLKESLLWTYNMRRSLKAYKIKHGLVVLLSHSVQGIWIKFTTHDIVPSQCMEYNNWKIYSFGGLILGMEVEPVSPCFLIRKPKVFNFGCLLLCISFLNIYPGQTPAFSIDSYLSICLKRRNLISFQVLYGLNCQNWGEPWRHLNLPPYAKSVLIGRYL